jgi:hypothetical protein
VVRVDSKVILLTSVRLLTGVVPLEIYTLKTLFCEIGPKFCICTRDKHQVIISDRIPQAQRTIRQLYTMVVATRLAGISASSWKAGHEPLFLIDKDSQTYWQ